MTVVTHAGGRDFAAVDELCRLVLVASRLGCRVRLFDVDADLRDLLVLAGVDALILDSEQKEPDLP